MVGQIRKWAVPITALKRVTRRYNSAVSQQRGAGPSGHRRKTSASQKDLDSLAVESFSKPSITHAVIIIFLEFFAWGLLTNVSISVLKDTFPDHTFLMNGLVQGVKGILAMLSAPILGALSDVWGRKVFLLLSVTFTCLPIPLMRINPWWYFATISLSGFFAVTFAIVFSYVSDLTQHDSRERTKGFGQVSATFAASIVVSPLVGTIIENYYGETAVILLATAIAALDVLFILVLVPESLADENRPVVHSSALTWEKADPFGALRKMSSDIVVLLLCLCVFFSYLPEAGQYSCIFVYLSNVSCFGRYEISGFVAMIGVLGVFAQTSVLSYLIEAVGPHKTIVLGLALEAFQLACFALAQKKWMVWVAGVIAAFSSLCYPAISSYVAQIAKPDQQGVAQGVVTGIRGLCTGLGPAIFGFIFYLCDVDLETSSPAADNPNKTFSMAFYIQELIPGPPFAFGSLLVALAIIVALVMPKFPAFHLAAKSGQLEAFTKELEVPDDEEKLLKHEYV